MTGKNTIPHSRRKSGKKAAKKNRRREEAQARQTAYDILGKDEQLIQRNFFRLRYLRQKGN